MAAGFDVRCSFCGKSYAPKRPDRLIRQLEKGQKYCFCSQECRIKYQKTFGFKMSEETKKKLSLAHKGKWSGEQNPNYKGVIVKRKWTEGAYRDRDISKDKNPAYIDGRSFNEEYRGSDWRSQKKKTLERDKVCTKCGSMLNLVVHHKIPYAISKDNNLGNLIVLCKTCHGKEHMVIGWNYFKNIGVTQ